MRCFRTRGKKGDKHCDPGDPPRRRANKRRGHGTSENDRPPVVGTVGRESGQCRLRVCQHTNGKTLQKHVHGSTQKDTTCYTDEGQGYNSIKRDHHTVCHGQKEWARDEDGDGWYETHTNSDAGMWVGLRNFLRPFRGVHKAYLNGYVAIYEFHVNLKAISPTFIAALVQNHSCCT